MSWFSTEKGSGPLYLQVRDKIRDLIRTRSLVPGTRVPPTRALAKVLGVSRNSVLAAYGNLTASGLLESRGKTGTFVRAAEVRADGTPENSSSQAPGLSPASRAHESPWRTLTPCPVCVPGEMLLRRDFNRRNPGRKAILSDTTPAYDPASAERFRTCLNYVLTNRPLDLLTSDDIEGYQPLREWLATYMNQRGVQCKEDNILVVDGYMEAMALLCRAIVRPGQTVLIENPCVASNISFLFCAGAKLQTVPVNGSGLDVDALERAAAETKPKLLCVTPLFHDPTGVLMTPETRRRVLDCANRHNFLIIENGFTDEFCYSGRLVPPLKSQDVSGRVVYVGSFGKLLFPELRVGWIVASDDAMEALVPVKHCMDLRTSTVLQAACYEFCRWGYLDSHMARTRRLYAKRRQVVSDSLARYMPQGVTWHVSEGGPVAWLTLPAGLGSKVIYDKAKQQGVHIGPGWVFYLPRQLGDGHIRLAYSSAPEREIEDGIRILGAIIADEMGLVEERKSQAIE